MGTVMRYYNAATPAASRSKPATLCVALVSVLLNSRPGSLSLPTSYVYFEECLRYRVGLISLLRCIQLLEISSLWRLKR